MEKPMYVVMTTDGDGTDTTITFNRDEAIELYNDSGDEWKVVGEVSPDKSFGQGGHGDWYGINVIEETEG